MSTDKPKKQIPAQNENDSAGESMKDSMTESVPGNDNALITPAEDLTDEFGKLDAEAFKKSYQNTNENQNSNNHGRQ